MNQPTSSAAPMATLTPPAVAEVARSIGENPYLLYLANLGGAESRRAMRGCLERIVVLLTAPEGDPPPGGWGVAFHWHEIRYQHTALISAILREQVTTRPGQPPQPWAPSYVARHLNALSGVLKQAWKVGLMSAEDYHRAIQMERPRGTREKTGRSIGGDEIAAMLAACLESDPPRGVRDAAIIAVLHSTGLRRAELAEARRREYNPGDRSLRIIGKGDRERIVYLHQDSAWYLNDWLRSSEDVRGPLVCPLDRWGNVIGRHMDPSSIGNVIDRRRREAGLTRMTPHDFRRTFAGEMLDSGADLVQVRDLLGHRSTEVTAGYDRRPARQRKAAVDKLKLPEPQALPQHAPTPTRTATD